MSGSAELDGPGGSRAEAVKVPQPPVQGILHGFPGLGDRAALLRGTQLWQRGHEVQLPVQVWKRSWEHRTQSSCSLPCTCLRGFQGTVVGLGGLGQEAPAVCAHLVEAVVCKSKICLKTSCEVWGEDMD